MARLEAFYPCAYQNSNRTGRDLIQILATQYDLWQMHVSTRPWIIGQCVAAPSADAGEQVSNVAAAPLRAYQWP
jgi:hypothetical protein